MTISTYAELKTGIANWLARSDLTGRDDEFIDNVEAKFNRRLRLRTQESVATGTFTAEDPAVALPLNFLEMRSFTFDVSDHPLTLEFATLEQNEALEWSSPGIPKYYTFANGGIRLFPAPDQAYTYTIRHYSKIPALSASATSNYIIANFPDAYLYGSLIEACAFIGDDPRLPMWKHGFEEVMEEIKRADARERFREPIIHLDPELLVSSVSRIETDS
jgi:hypothetical protein